MQQNCWFCATMSKYLVRGKKSGCGDYAGRFGGNIPRLGDMYLNYEGYPQPSDIYHTTASIVGKDYIIEICAHHIQLQTILMEYLCHQQIWEMRVVHYARCQRFTATLHLRSPPCLMYRQGGTFKDARST